MSNLDAELTVILKSPQILTDFLSAFNTGMISALPEISGHGINFSVYALIYLVYVNVECMAVIVSETSSRRTEGLEHGMLDANI